MQGDLNKVSILILKYFENEMVNLKQEQPINFWKEPNYRNFFFHLRGS